MPSTRTIPVILTGKEICRLMRRHRTTIRSLSVTMGITHTRIRQVRQHGLTDRHAARDWLEAISGTDPGPQ